MTGFVVYDIFIKKLNKNEMRFNMYNLKILNYPDFVGAINQTNVLPGAYDTLSRWRVYSDINKSSYILQVACTTGFQSREIAYSTGCSGDAVDLSEIAIQRAIQNQSTLLKENRINYIAQDANTFLDITDKKYSHIIFGAGLGFFPEPKKTFEKAIDHLEDGGYILASPFYATRPIPTEIIEEARKIFGIEITTSDYKSVMDLYINSGLEVIYEERKTIKKENRKELELYVNATIDRVEKELNLSDEEKKYAQERLISIREMTNKLREYQEYAVLVLRKRKCTYPNRYVELF
ncbi:class I SAM-dependent methyltransferase [Enterococcus cecorum]|uniref:class I SAM-dependent methyltransferase n=1 Tax=Enterococcus cecorum TaxID=44008 RepID=UPI0013A5F8D1|nr:class I SAM-dependent methyltransferase [Enterococcus cecorum]